MSDPDVGVLITNSNVKHQLTGSEYPERRAACLDSARVMEVDSLRDVNLDTLQAEMEKWIFFEIMMLTKNKTLTGDISLTSTILLSGSYSPQKTT